MEKKENNIYSARFNEALWFPKRRFSVTQGGGGGIGSWLSLLLSRVRANIVLFEFDRIENHNIGGQLFPVDSEGDEKSSQIAKNIKTYTGDEAEDIVVLPSGKVTEDSDVELFSKYTVSGFDNMKARKIFFDKWISKYEGEKDSLFIDGRMTMENFQIFTFSGDDKESIKIYKEEFLFDDNEVEEVNCNAKSTSHFGAMIASFMVNYLTNHLANINHFKANIRVIPFCTTYDGDLALLNKDHKQLL